MEWIDTHAHLYAEDFNGRIGELVRRAREASVSRIISVGVNARLTRSVSALPKSTKKFCRRGWQPTDLDELGEEMELSARRLQELREQASHPKVVAIGEIGSIISGSYAPGAIGLCVKERQKRVFRQQLELAAELACPVIHQRRRDPGRLPGNHAPSGRARSCRLSPLCGRLETAQAFFDSIAW